MQRAHVTIQWHITLLSGLCLLAVVAALIGGSAYQNQASAKLPKEQSSGVLGQAALERLHAQAVAHGQDAQAGTDADWRDQRAAAGNDTEATGAGVAE